MGKITPSQTVGPYFKYGLTPGNDYAWNDAFGNDLVTRDVSGERIRIVGHVYDGEGRVMPDSMLEIWQADALGRFADPQDNRSASNAAFKGFGRCGTDEKGGYEFHTIKPGPVPTGPGGPLQAPHILLAVFARGLTQHAITRIYFEDEAANVSDQILALVPAERRFTLIARRERGDVATYRFDIHFQGDEETVFFDL